MNFIGFAATLFLLSLGTYPVVEARIASLPLPSILLGLLLGLLLLNSLAGYRLVLTSHDKKIFFASTFLALWLTLVTFASSAAFGYEVGKQEYVGIGYVFAFPALVLVFRHLKVVWLLWALLGGCTLALSIGYIRFITLGGGILNEHTLGYWGIKYLPSTRNSDVLYPIVSSLVATGLYAIARTSLVRVVLIFVAIASFAAVILSLSRGAWIALSTGYIALLWFTRQQHVAVRRRFKTIGVIVLVGIIVVAWFQSTGIHTEYDVIVDRMRSIADTGDPRVSNRDRLDLAMDAVIGILRHPTGVGVGNIAYALGRPVHSIGSAENAWLTIGLEGGWLALATFSLLFFWLFLLIRPTILGRITTTNNLSPTIGMALVVAIFSYLMFNYELDSLFLWSVLAVAWSTKRSVRDAINWQDIGANGSVQCAGHNRRRIALDSGADSSGR